MASSPHPLQGPLDALPDYLTDARNLYEVAERQRAELSQARRASGNATGAGRPAARYKSINRAVVVASVGALEAFSEDLAITAQPLIPGTSTTASWFEIAGTKGMVQTPNPWNLAKMLWVYFRYDPRPDWDLLITTSWSEVAATGTNWRGTTKRYTAGTSPTSADALSAMVKVRHGFAHQDTKSQPRVVPGVVSVTPKGNLSLQSHHAFNSMSIVAQIAIQMTMGLSTRVPGPTAKFKWRKVMTTAGLERLLTDTPVAKTIKNDWAGSPF